MHLSRETMVAQMLAADRAADGTFIVAVKTTGIYCLPSCRPARKPKPENVVFYATPEEARAAGFRPCKLCRPDDHYRGRYLEEERLEGAVMAVAADPAACAGVAGLAAAVGVGQSKLHDLCRLYYHATPADVLARLRVAAACTRLAGGRDPVVEVGLAVGFESLSAFNTNFRKYTALSPLGYRRLGLEHEFTLSLPAGYPIARVLAYLGRDRHSLSERVEGETYTAALRLRGEDGPRQVVARATLRPGAVLCRVESAGAPGPLVARQVHGRLLATLGLVSDPLHFEARVAGAPDLAPLIAGQRGLRIPLVADPFDCLVWAITGQQITVALACLLRRRLVELTGVPAGEGLYAPPSAEAVGALEPGDLTALGYARAKAGYLVDAARAVAEGRLPLHALQGAPATRVERTLLAVRGIGPWSAHYLMMRSFGFGDCVPLGDTGLMAGLQRLFGLAERPGRDETLALMSRFSPYRSLATFHLWQRQGTAA